MFPQQQINPMMSGMGGFMPQPDTSYIDQQVQQQQQMMQRPVQAMPNLFNEGLNYLDEGVDQYYSTYNKLNNFAQTLWKNYNIDVTAPDPSDERSVLASKLFNKYLTEMQVLGNRLKTSQSDLAMVRNAQVYGQLEGPMGTDYASSMENMYSVKPLPEVTNYNAIVGEGWYDEEQRKSHDLMETETINKLNAMQAQARTQGEYDRIEAAKRQLIKPFQTALPPGVMSTQVKSDARNRMLEQVLIGNNGIPGIFTGNNIAASQMLRSAPGSTSSYISDDGTLVVRERTNDGSFKIGGRVDLTNEEAFSQLMQMWNQGSINTGDQISTLDVEEFVDKNWEKVQGSIPGLKDLVSSTSAQLSPADKVALASKAFANQAREKFATQRQKINQLSSTIKQSSPAMFKDGEFVDGSFPEEKIKELSSSIKQAYASTGNQVMVPAGMGFPVRVKGEGDYVPAQLPMEGTIVGSDKTGTYIRLKDPNSTEANSKIYITNEYQVAELAKIPENAWLVDLVLNLYSNKESDNKNTQNPVTGQQTNLSDNDPFFN